MTDDQIRETFLANGFTIKEGQTDLKPYVYAAARALLALAASPADQGEDARDAAMLRWAIKRFENADALATFVLQHEGMDEEGLRRDIEGSMSATPPAAHKE